MKLPFSENTTEFEQEFKEALGFTDVDIPYRKMKPDLKLAANEIIRVISKSIYDELIKNYELNVEGVDQAAAPFRDESLNESFQYAMATFAYSSFAPANDLAHTPNGRRMRSSDDEKTPFEWMLANDDDLLQKRAFKALDSLILYMDENYDKWKESDQFKLTHKFYLRTLEDFSEAYVLDSRLLLIKLVPGIKRAEKREIYPRIGAELNVLLKEKIIYQASGSTGDTSKIITEDEALLIDLIKEACAYYALSWAFTRLQVNIFPEGVLQAVRGERITVKGRKTPDVPVIDQISKLFKEDCDIILLDIENQITKMFPPEPVERNENETNEEMYGFGDDDPFVNT